MSLEKYLVDNNCKLDDVMLYWCGDGHFIDYRPEMGDMVPIFPDWNANVSELNVFYAENRGGIVRLTLDCDW